MLVSNKLGDRLIGAAQVASLFATAWFVWVYRVLPRLGLQSLTSIAAQSLFYVILAWLSGGMVAFCLYFVISLADLPGASRLSLRSSAPAMWFAPAIVLLSTPLPAAFTISVFLVVTATRQLILQWGAIDSPLQTSPAELHPALPFQTAGPDADFFSWKSAPVLMASLSAQAGLVALLFRYQFRAAALFALSTAILTALSMAAGFYRPAKARALPHSAISVGLTFLLAASLTFGGISIGRGRGGGSDTPGSDTAGAGDQPNQQQANQDESSADRNLGFGGDFPGVILLPEAKPHVALVVPVMAPPRAFGAPLPKPVGIPFTGPYWLFRWPGLAPPRHSVIRRGNASEMSFHTTDGWPMEMEARQRLDMPVSVHCCAQIQLAIRNADLYPGTVSLELILIDTSLPIHRTQSLGSVPAGAPSPSEETLNFRMAAAADFQKFDELEIVFHRARARADKSARIAIQRIVLAP